MSDFKGISPSDWGRIDAVEGWLAYGAAELSWLIIGHQERTGAHGSILELGVFRGKYLSSLYLASKNHGGKVVGIDAFLERIGVPLCEDWYQNARSVIETNVRSVAGEIDRLTLVRSDTTLLKSADLARDFAPEFSFISVDAGHESHEVLSDFKVVAPLLSRGGVIAADDVFNSTVPSVIEGVFEYFKHHNTERLMPFAYGGNKLFICRAEMHDEYMKLVKRFAAAGVGGYRKASHDRSVENSSSGYTPTFIGHEVLPFLV